MLKFKKPFSVVKSKERGRLSIWVEDADLRVVCFCDNLPRESENEEVAHMVAEALNFNTKG